MDRCPKCPWRNNPDAGRHQPVLPDGPLNCDILFIGENPGREENNKHRPFIGMSGREFNEHYLPLAGLSRDSIRITNTVKCYLPNGDSPAEDVIDSCSKFHLEKEIALMAPWVIVPMGAVACSLFPEVNLEMHHGMPIPANASKYERTRWIFPMWHPASGLHDKAKMIPLRQDFVRLGEFLVGRLSLPSDDFPYVDYNVIETHEELSSVLYGSSELDVAMDTETEKGKLWCLTFSNVPGTGYMIREGDVDLLNHFTGYLNKYHKGKIIFHNWMYDIPVLDEAGVFVPKERTVDTMVIAYHLGSVPQSLKQLAYRLCGMEMKEFSDLVMPYAVNIAIEYLLNLSSHDWPKPSEELVLTNEGTYKVYRPQGLNTKLKRLFTDFSKNPDMNVFKRYNGWSDQEKNMAAEVFGYMPEPRISQAPMSEIIGYACRDADATLRVYPKLVEEVKLFKSNHMRMSGRRI